MSTSKPRQQKTPRQRAEEQLGLATRKHDKAHAEVKRLRKDLEDAEARLQEAVVRRQYAAEDPALKNTTTARPTTTSTGATR